MGKKMPAISMPDRLLSCCRSYWNWGVERRTNLKLDEL